MSLDEPRNPKHAAMAESDSHPAWVAKRHPVNRGDERDLYLIDLAEQIHIRRDELAVLEATYARVAAAEVPHDPDPGIDYRRPGYDPRLFDQGTDASEEWVIEEARLPRSVVSIETGGRT